MGQYSHPGGMGQISNSGRASLDPNIRDRLQREERGASSARSSSAGRVLTHIARTAIRSANMDEYVTYHHSLDGQGWPCADRCDHSLFLLAQAHSG
jgi:hypothetical protein